MTDLGVVTILFIPGPIPLILIHFCFSSPLYMCATFGFPPSKFIQVGFHLLGRFSAPILALSPLPLNNGHLGGIRTLLDLLAHSSVRNGTLCHFIFDHKLTSVNRT